MRIVQTRRYLRKINLEVFAFLILKRDKDICGDIEKVEELDCIEFENVMRSYIDNSLELSNVKSFPLLLLKREYYSVVKPDKLDMIVVLNFSSILCLHLLWTLTLS